MIVTGHETTANTIYFSLMELAGEPKVTEGLQKEVESIFGDEPPQS
jgi:cytochrome P450